MEFGSVPACPALPTRPPPPALPADFAAASAAARSGDADTANRGAADLLRLLVGQHVLDADNLATVARLAGWLSGKAATMAAAESLADVVLDEGDVQCAALQRRFDQADADGRIAIYRELTYHAFPYCLMPISTVARYDLGKAYAHAHGLQTPLLEPKALFMVAVERRAISGVWPRRASGGTPG